MAQKNKHQSTQQRKRLLQLYAAFLAVLSFSLFLMPFGLRQGNDSMLLTYLSGALFWIGLIGTVVMAVHITKSRCKSREFAAAHPNHKQLGLVHFFQNTSACICDGVMLVSIAGFVITRILAALTVWPFVFLSVFVFSFGMHCMLNGSNYIYINYRTRRVIES